MTATMGSFWFLATYKTQLEPHWKFISVKIVACILFETRGLLGLIGIACKFAFDALEKESILLYNNGLQCFESVKDGYVPKNFWYHICLRGLNWQTNKLTEKAGL